MMNIHVRNRKINKIDAIKAFQESSFTNKQGYKQGQSQHICMASDKWFPLEKTRRDIWDGIEEKSKATILVNITLPKNSQHRKSFSKRTLPNNGQVNLHEVSADEFIQANMHNLEIAADVSKNINPDKSLEDTVQEGFSNQYYQSHQYLLVASLRPIKVLLLL
jgi:hypothetical protein